MFSDKLYYEISAAYADMLIKFFPDQKENYKTLVSRAKLIIDFIFKNYCIVSNDHIKDIIKNDNIDISVLENIFGEKVIEDLIYEIYNRNNTQ